MLSSKRNTSKNQIDPKQQDRQLRLKRIFKVWKLELLEQKYQKVQVQSQFRTWNQLLQVKRQKDWRNHIRASVHYNYTRYSKVWNAWESWVEKQRFKKSKIIKARDHYNHRISRVAFDAFKVYVQSRQEKHERGRIALVQYHQKKFTFSLRRWKEQYLFSSNLRSTRDLARYMEIQQYKTKYFRKWLEKFVTSKTCVEILDEAIHFHSNTLTRRLFHAWLSIGQKKATLQYRLVDYEQERESLILSFVFQHWISSTKISLFNRERQEQVHVNYLSRLKKKQFLVWKSKAIEAIVMQSKNGKAMANYEKSIKRTILVVLKNRVQDVKHAAVVYEGKLVTEAMLCWKAMLKRQRKLRLEKELEPGLCHHHKVLKAKVLGAFIKFVSVQKHEKSQEFQALVFWKQNVLTDRLRQWMSKSVKKSIVQEMVCMADEFKYERMVERSWRAWLQSIDQKLELDRKMVIAEKHRQQELLRSGLNGFIAFACRKSKKRLKEHYADIQYQQTLVCNHFERWEVMVDTKIMVHRMNEKADQFRKYCNFKIIWNRWCKRIVQRKQAVVKWNLTEAHYERVVLQRHFCALVEYVKSINSFRREIRAFHARQRQRVVIRYFKKWSKYSNHLELMKLDARVFYDGIKSGQLECVFAIWSGKTVDAFCKEDKLFRVFKSFQTEKVYDLQFKSLHKWLYLLHQKQKIVKLERKANHFHMKKNCKVVIQLWKRKYKHHRWIHQNHALALQFFAKSIQQKYFGLWHGFSDDWKSLYHKRHVLPVQFYQDKLLCKVLDDWKSKVAESKVLKARIEEIDGWRRKKMTQETLYDWYMLEQEQLFEAQRQSGMSKRHLYLGAKYGRRWRIMTMENKSRQKKLFSFVKQVPSLDLPLTLNNRSRPAPRKPSFVFDSETNRFQRLGSDFGGSTVSAVAIPRSNSVYPVAKMNLIAVQRPVTDALFDTNIRVSPLKSFETPSLDTRIDRVSRTPPVTNVFQKPAIEIDPQTDVEPSLVIPIVHKPAETQTETTRIQPPLLVNKVLETPQKTVERAVYSPSKSIATQYENPTTPPTTPVPVETIAKPKARMTIEQLQAKLNEIQLFHTQLKDYKDQLQGIDDKLVSYAEAVYSHKLRPTLEELLTTRKSLLIQISDYERKQSQMRKELLEIKSEISLLME